MIAPLSAKTNFIWAASTKAISIISMGAGLPVLLHLLGSKSYGTWVTLASLTSFISLLDLGFGNSIRNSVASLSKTNLPDVQSEFIGFFRILSIVSILGSFGLAIVFSLLKLQPSESTAAALLYFPVVLTLPLILGSSVIIGARAYGIQAILQAAGSWAFILVACLFVASSFSPNLAQLAIVWSATYVFALSTLFTISIKYLRLKVSSLFGYSLTGFPRKRLRKGLQFLILQSTALVVYGLGNVLIYGNLGPEEVARYDSINKIFQVGFGIYNIIISVMWSEISVAKARKDTSRLYGILRSLIFASLLFSGACLLVALASPYVINVWSGGLVNIAFLEALPLAVLASIQSIAYVGAVFMNAFEQIRLQIIMAVFSLLMMIPLASLFFSWGYGIVSVPVASIILTVLPAFVCSYFALRLIRSLAIQGAPLS
jgi:O-antigen/teichoic acid export membrane protein